MEYRNSFIEGYSGSCSVSLNINESFKYHICVDKDRDIINFWDILQLDYKCGRLYKFLCNTEYSEENFEAAKKYLRDHSDEITDPFFHAAMYFICNRMSRSADMKTFGWSDRLRRGMPEYISAYTSAVSSLPLIADRIKNIEFVCSDYIQYMKDMQWNECRNVCSYIDPPYLKSTRVSKEAYGRYEMSDEDHNKLLYFITKCCRGITFISGYESLLYSSALAEHKKYIWEVANSSSQLKIKPRKRECLWEVYGL